MGHLPSNHDAGRVMASLHPWNIFLHLTGYLSINLVVCTAPWWWRFSCLWRDVFMPVLSMPLEEMLCSCTSDHLQSRCKDVSLWAEVDSQVLIIPNEARHWLGRHVQLSEHDLLFPEWISANPLPHSFDSGLIPQTFQVSWLSPVFNPPEFLMMFNCLIDEQSWNFQWF